MKTVNRDKLIVKTSKRLHKLTAEMAKMHSVKCPCCGEKVAFDGYAIKFNKKNDYEFDFSSPYYVECPSCENKIALGIKYGKFYSKRYEINSCKSLLNI